MRCRACNKKLSEFELSVKNPETGEFEDLCGTCRKAARMAEPPSEEDKLAELLDDAFETAVQADY